MRTGGYMRLSDYQLRNRLGAKKEILYTDKGLAETIERSKAAFAESEAKNDTSYAEFLYQQSRYIRKRWWILQGMLLLLIWFMLQMTESSIYVQRYMGIAASLFAILLLPELWKNRNANALEIESVSYYSLRQIYSARILAFALVDFLLICAFTLSVVFTGNDDSVFPSVYCDLLYLLSGVIQQQNGFRGICTLVMCCFLYCMDTDCTE